MGRTDDMLIIRGINVFPSQVEDVLSAADLNVEYMYAFVSRATEKAMVVFRFERIDAAIAALKKAGVSVVEAEKVYTL